MIGADVMRIGQMVEHDDEASDGVSRRPAPEYRASDAYGNGGAIADDALMRLKGHAFEERARLEAYRNVASRAFAQKQIGGHGPWHDRPRRESRADVRRRCSASSTAWMP